MEMQEMVRFIEGLRADGWSEKKVNDFLIFIGTGDERYKPNGTDMEVGADDGGGAVELD